MAAILTAGRIFGRGGLSFSSCCEGSQYLSSTLVSLIFLSDVVLHARNMFAQMTRVFCSHLERSLFCIERVHIFSETHCFSLLQVYDEKWVDVAQHIPGRTDRQIRERWKNRLTVEDTPFDHEVYRLYMLYMCQDISLFPFYFVDMKKPLPIF